MSGAGLGLPTAAAGPKWGEGGFTGKKKEEKKIETPEVPATTGGVFSPTPTAPTTTAAPAKPKKEEKPKKKEVNALFAGITKKEEKDSDDSSNSDSEDSSDHEEQVAPVMETGTPETLISTDPSADLESIMGIAPEPVVQFDPLAG